MLLGKKIYFKQVDGNISLIDEQGTESVETPEFWSLSTTNGKNVLTIQNQILYSLPSTGGSGIYWYMIGGMVLMSTAAWILYKNKCKEVLGK
ncbi:LPXTG cell wall anchor domain-containing protein [Blautia obeum]|nr:LPXTG cell wall anchor domain-containing protein [Blautia obeum]